jgi:hypothetical protein
MKPFLLAAFLPGALVPIILTCQTTQGSISGSLSDGSGAPVRGVVFYCRIAGDGSIVSRGSAPSDDKGYYAFPALSPGEYRLRAQNEGNYLERDNECFPEPAPTPKYQAQEKHDLTLPVAGQMTVDFELRPAEKVFDSGAPDHMTRNQMLVRYFGTDERSMLWIPVDTGPASQQTGGPTLSYVVDPSAIDNLPFQGRDVYAALVLLPGVTTDVGDARGLGVSVNGQRPSSSNFLLDGVENNNTLITGPLTPVAPEAIQEYRVSTSTWSAQYGRTAGFIANAVTKAGGPRFHGLVYFYLQNDSLNANDFQDNRNGIARRPDKQDQAGYQTGGPLPKRTRVFWSSAFERLRSRSLGDPAPYSFLTPAEIQKKSATAPAPFAELLSLYPGPSVTPSFPGSPTGTLSIARPSAVDRSLALDRFDYRGASERIMARLSLSRTVEPDFLWSAYPGFTSPLRDTAISIALADQHSFSPSWVNELRAAYGSDRMAWDRAHSEVPTLVTQDGSATLTLPGSPDAYSYLDDTHNWQILDNATWTHRQHIVTFGASILPRTWKNFQTTDRDGVYTFNTVSDFENNVPFSLLVGYARGSATEAPDYSRNYQSLSWNFFVQDAFRVSRRLTLNAGLRYEKFGAPRNTGATPDITVQVQPGMTVTQPNALFLSQTVRTIYRADPNDWAPRVGLAWDLTGNGATQFRAGYGIFYDQPFDNLWQEVSNNGVQAPLLASVPRVNYLNMNPQTAAAGSFFPSLTTSPDLTMFDPNFRNGRVQSYFYGISRGFGKGWLFEVDGSGALGRHLVTTDMINRDFTSPCQAGTYECRQNAAAFLDDVEYHAPQGSSSYQALSALARYRTRHAEFQAAWTWSHSIDNQSEPLGFSLFNLDAIKAPQSSATVAAFSTQFDSSSDRANSDFDQRQSLVFYSIFDIPEPSGMGRVHALFRNWRFSELAAFRSGFPFSVYASSLGQPPNTPSGAIENSRANLIEPNAAHLAQPTAGGEILLNIAAFSAPAAGKNGTSGRNEFRGPGLITADISLSRAFPLRCLGESGTVVLRADAFNFLNHANLGNPNTQWTAAGSPTFGQAVYGLQGDAPAAFPAATPLNESPRQVQILMRLQW